MTKTSFENIHLDSASTSMKNLTFFKNSCHFQKSVFPILIYIETSGLRLRTWKNVYFRKILLFSVQICNLCIDRFRYGNFQTIFVTFDKWEDLGEIKWVQWPNCFCTLTLCFYEANKPVCTFLGRKELLLEPFEIPLQRDHLVTKSVLFFFKPQRFCLKSV